jgi:hypothetical protein
MSRSSKRPCTLKNFNAFRVFCTTPRLTIHAREQTFQQTQPQASSGPCLSALVRLPHFSVAAVEMFPERTSDIAHRLYFKVYTHLVSIRLVVVHSSHYGLPALFGGAWQNENEAAWQFCGECIMAAGFADLYPMGHTHFTDRHKGAPFFQDFLPGIIACSCSKHMLDNARNKAPIAQKGFHDNMFWAVHLTKFQHNYPAVKVYLEAIPREQ